MEAEGEALRRRFPHLSLVEAICWPVSREQASICSRRRPETKTVQDMHRHRHLVEEEQVEAGTALLRWLRVQRLVQQLEPEVQILRVHSRLRSVSARASWRIVTMKMRKRTIGIKPRSHVAGYLTCLLIISVNVNGPIKLRQIDKDYVCCDVHQSTGHPSQHTDIDR